jgi:N-methylhydantoinase A
LRAAGFRGRLLMITASGGVLDAADMAAAPIHSIGSGPSMAPAAGRYYASVEAESDSAIVADTGGTSYDVTLVRRGSIPFTRETWLGAPIFGHITGFPAVDVNSIGAGGGSIAWLDKGGLLHVGPASAGADPGPVCYMRGGTRPTVTDACLVLGYVDPSYFLGGSMSLDLEAAEQAIRTQIAEPLKLEVQESAAAIMTVATELMVQAIEEITVNQGVDPRAAVLVGGGGAAGLNCVAIARRLGCSRVVIPPVVATLSAAGAMMSDLATEFSMHFMTSTASFDLDGANRILAQLERKCHEFVSKVGSMPEKARIACIAETRYAGEVWQLDLPLRGLRFDSDQAVRDMVADFHALHEDVYAVRDPRSAVEIVSMRTRVSCSLDSQFQGRVRPPARHAIGEATRSMYFAETGPVDGVVWRLEDMNEGQEVSGPAVIESPFTTIVIDPQARAELRASGSLVLTPGATAEVRSALASPSNVAGRGVE